MPTPTIKSILSSWFYYRDVINPKKRINRTDYWYLCAKFNEYMVERVLDGEEICLPLNLGVLDVIGKKAVPKIDKDGNIQGMTIDHKKMMKVAKKDPDSKKMFYHLNLHTDGIIYKLRWRTYIVDIPFFKYYAFIAASTFKHKLSVRIFGGKSYKTK